MVEGSSGGALPKGGVLQSCEHVVFDGCVQRVGSTLAAEDSWYASTIDESTLSAKFSEYRGRGGTVWGMCSKRSDTRSCNVWSKDEMISCQIIKGCR